MTGDTARVVRCATFNVLHGRRLRQDGRPLSAHAEAAGAPLAEAVASLDADVLALQEVDRLQERSGRIDQAAAAAAAMAARDWRYASALHGRSIAGGGWVLDPAEPGLRMYGPEHQRESAGQRVPSQGVALLSRLPVREWRARRLRPAPVAVPLRVAGQPGLTLVRDQPRVALAAALEGPRGPFTAVAVHLSFVPGWNITQLLTVRRWMADLPRPHVLLGDFNLIGAIPGAVLNAAELLERCRTGSRLDAPASRGWRDLVRTSTYPSHDPLVQFDHVLARGAGVDPVGGARTPRAEISDHRPLVVELTL
ncbi:endonuclease/exonuclease/phosphatase family protein [Streptomyces sp. NPDC047082]|uniref:endonuclease/exonuclease/phosphatase family protein n=1 Tax=Streptomyces sp. NPDC047082 TaxID=3155259 RepID=UPI0033F2EDA2